MVMIIDDNDVQIMLLLWMMMMMMIIIINGLNIMIKFDADCCYDDDDDCVGGGDDDDDNDCGDDDDIDDYTSYICISCSCDMVVHCYFKLSIVWLKCVVFGHWDVTKHLFLNGANVDKWS